MSEFITACKLFIRIKMSEEVVEEQVQWVFLYVQRETADIWKENVLEDLETRVQEFEIIRELLKEIKKRVWRRI